VIDPAYGNLPGVEYVDIAYDKYEGKGDDKRRVGECLCRYAQTEGKAVLPRILQRLLGARKATRKRMEHVRLENGDVGALDTRTRAFIPADDGDPRVLEPDAVAAAVAAYDGFQRAVLDGLQVAYKVTANSLYGQMGARTSALYLKHVAACTTAVGRAMITKAKGFIESQCDGRVIYGDTDSIFIEFKTAPGLSDRDALASAIRQGQAASNGIKPLLKAPHNLECVSGLVWSGLVWSGLVWSGLVWSGLVWSGLVWSGRFYNDDGRVRRYEKTMFPLLLLSKKRYVGLLYENDPDAKPKQKSMGIALKRRDYAPIVKTIYGGIIDIILHRRDIPAAVAFLQQKLRELADGKVDLEELVISKTLRSYYKLPHQIAHWVLSRRMFERDPGSAPQTNDRVPYVFVECNKKNALMGDRIEHVDHVRRHGLRVDTKTYIENQIMAPCTQLLAISMEKLPGFKYSALTDPAVAMGPLVAAKNGNVRKARVRLDTLREREVERIIFAPVLAMPAFRQRDNRVSGQNEITKFFVSKIDDD
jgi:DNA polymerase elongation subunit (family B)